MEWRLNLTKNNTSKNITFTDNYTKHNHKNKTLCFGAVICLPEAERAKRRYKHQEDDFFSAVFKIFLVFLLSYLSSQNVLDISRQHIRSYFMRQGCVRKSSTF